MTELFDIVSESNKPTGETKARKLVHQDGDWHRSVHVWVLRPDGQLLLQKRSITKDSWPGRWDISCAGHISASETPLYSAVRECREELGLTITPASLEFLFVSRSQAVTDNGKFNDNEFNYVYLLRTGEFVDESVFVFADGEVTDVRFHQWTDVLRMYQSGDESIVPQDVTDGTNTYKQLFDAIELRLAHSAASDAARLRAKATLAKYQRVEFGTPPSELPDSTKACLTHLQAASRAIDDIFLMQQWVYLPQWTNQCLARCSNEEQVAFRSNRGPWDCLTGKSFVSPANCAEVSIPQLHASKAKLAELKVLVAVPKTKPATPAMYPLDILPREFDALKAKNPAATSFYTCIERADDDELATVPYSSAYAEHVGKLSNHLREAAGALSDDNPTKALLLTKAEDLLRDDYLKSDELWLKLKPTDIDITVGPYETYIDEYQGLKSTYEMYVGIADKESTDKLQLIGTHLGDLEKKLPYERPSHAPLSGGDGAAPIRVMNLVLTAGDVGGPMTLAFNLPNDDVLVTRFGTAQVMMKNVSAAKFEHIMLPLARACLAESLVSDVTFDAFFTHTLCHELCHGIGPHTLTLESGTSSVRERIGTDHSALEEAKADVVGFWALHELVEAGAFPTELSRACTVTFVIGCIRSVRFGSEEAHAKGQALALARLLKDGAIAAVDGVLNVPSLQGDESACSVLQSLTRLAGDILRIQGAGDHEAAVALLAEASGAAEVITACMVNVEKAAVPVDLAPQFV